MQDKSGKWLKPVIALALSFAIALPAALAQQNAEALVASKRPADMSYRDLMQILGRALNWIQGGILLQNKQLVREGGAVVVNHPAPRHKPWTIMEAADQESFKQSLLAYDKILDAKANAVVAAAEKAEWLEASSALADYAKDAIMESGRSERLYRSLAAPGRSSDLCIIRATSGS